MMTKVSPQAARAFCLLLAGSRRWCPLMKRSLLLIPLAAVLVISLSGCAAVGSLLGSILRVPGSLLNSVTENDTTDRVQGELPGPMEETPEAISIATIPADAPKR